ncbi:hypothetical protein [Desulfosporosinus metallidurans]|uniref:Uncharacterized protein n=1 Tax=Desulfosporosinus metallidurans TaxID=1888891 RepID=A0A1Q8QNP7_9FIRM|nr:hypothetical protein [Desulfosporosinus metallidurans]OLN28973.1 hypothetical protein DSOL_3784 [Desulfosporosinus metallidurans]
MAIIYKKCTKCGSKNSVKIDCGMPGYERSREAEAGKMNPDYSCNDCGHEWNRKQAMDEAYGKIKIIKASVGGYFGGYYDVTVDFDNLQTTWSFNEGETQKTSKRSIQVSTSQAFIEKLKMVNLLNWKANYTEVGVCDGTHWSVEIFTVERTIKKYGDNMFPLEWELFCKSIGRITNRKFH